MAGYVVSIPDEAILELLREQGALIVDDSVATVTETKVLSTPPVVNGVVSHLVEVTVSVPLGDAQLNTLVKDVLQ